MRYHFLFSIFLCLITITVKAQNTYAVKGVAADTSANVKLVNTSIAILNAKDSTLYKFTRAAADGSFVISNLKSGRFILLVTYPGYVDYVERFYLDSVQKQKNFGELKMLLKENLLQDVIIKGEAIAMKIKGDTTEFNAAAFTIEPNTKVEDLLKQLPGIQIDNTGKITAQGKTVEKVLVDGEEFFGDDPTLVTKNLRADMVDKVQLFDKKSDQASFTKVDDGVKIKTLNIKLKEDKKNGYFGKLDGGAATKGYFQAQGMTNVFKAKKKFSAYATLGNTGKTGLNFSDNNKFGASPEISGNSPIVFIDSDEFESFTGRYNNRGIPSAQTGGVHYDSKWNQDKESVNVNFRLGSIGIEGTKNNINQNNLSSGAIFNNSDQAFNNTAFREKVDATYQLKIDSTSNLKISLDGTLKNSSSNNTFDASSISGENVFLNKSRRILTNENKQQLFNASIFWNKKFRKPGRNISLTINNSLNLNETNGFLNSATTFYNSQGTSDHVELVDQFKTGKTLGSMLSSNLVYTEPISKALSAIVNYGFGINNSTSEIQSLNKSQQGAYTLPEPDFSNDFSLNQRSNQAGAIFNYRKDKTEISLGSKVLAVNLKQTDNFRMKVYDRNYLNLSPNASFNYKLAKQKNIRLYYNGLSTQPVIAQIQPGKVNDDPLNIVIGNPDLKPSFSNYFSMSYDSFKILTNQSIFLSASYSFISSAIVNDLFTNETGKNTSRSVNVDGRAPSTFYIYTSISRKINKAGLNTSLRFNASGNKYYSFINNALNTTKSYNFSGGLSIRQYVANKYGFDVTATPTYTKAQSSLQKQVNNNGWGLNSSATYSVTLPGKLEFRTDGEFEYKGKTQSFNNDLARINLNSTLSKKFMKGDPLKLSLSGNDLLNQNTGFSRSANGSFITETSYSTIKRYFMVSLIYDFSKMGATPTK